MIQVRRQFDGCDIRLDSEVRKCVFSLLDSQFDNYLAQSPHLNSLFVALNDEVFAIRGLVMQCLGRLSDINPACVQPTLRSVLLKVSSILMLLSVNSCQFSSTFGDLI